MIVARLKKSFPEAKQSADFHLNVEFTAGDGITVLFGPSGAGKTLILDCIAGFVRPDSGRILLNEDLLFDGQTGVWLRPQVRRCGYVFQNYALFPNMTIRQNLMFGAANQRSGVRHEHVNEMLDRFRLQDVAARLPHALSGGQKQRSSIARALLSDPKLLLLDEPTRGMDGRLRNEFYDLLRDLRQQFALPTLLVTHSLDEALELADSMIVMRAGSILQVGSPRSIFEEPATLELAKLLGIDNILPVEIRSLDPSRNTSVLRYGDYDIQASYFPGRFKGDRVHLLVSPHRLRVIQRFGRMETNQIPVELSRTIPTLHGLRWEFEGGLRVETGFATVSPRDTWAVEFPTQGLRIL